MKFDTAPGFILSKGIFIVPEGENVYKVGATYDWDHPYSGITQKGKTELMNQANQLLNSPSRVIDHYSGIRPATHDRRPFIGFHPEYPLIGIFNGFGSKGVSLIPYFAEKFIAHMEEGADMDNEANIIRFFN